MSHLAHISIAVWDVWHTLTPELHIASEYYLRSVRGSDPLIKTREREQEGGGGGGQFYFDGGVRHYLCQFDQLRPKLRRKNIMIRWHEVEFHRECMPDHVSHRTRTCILVLHDVAC